MTLKTLRDNLLWIAFFLCVATYVQARNEYLNDYNTCERGHWETYTELRQHEYKSGSSAESQNQTLGFRFRMPLGALCEDEYIAEMQKKNELKTQSELIKEGKRITNRDPTPVEFTE